MNTPDSNPAPDDTESVENQEEGSLTFWQVLSSTLAAAVGVQSSANRKRDFSRGKASHFILMGIGFTVLFVLLMAAFVSMILPN